MQHRTCFSLVGNYNQTNFAVKCGGLIVATGVDTFNVTVNAALPAGTNVIGHVITDTGSTTTVTGTVAVSGTVTANQGTNPWITNIEASGVPLTATLSGSPPVEALNVYVVNQTSGGSGGSVLNGTRRRAPPWP